MSQVFPSTPGDKQGFRDSESCRKERFEMTNGHL